MSAQPKPVLLEKPAAEIQFDSWPRISPGIYKAYSRRAKVYQDKQFKRWVCLVRFDVLDDNLNTIETLPWFLNLGQGEKPKASSRSNFYTAWVRANNGRPLRQDRMAPEIFTRRYATVVVDYTKKNHLQEPTTERTCYSVITAIQSWDTESNSQVVKQSTKPILNRHIPQAVTGNQWQSGKGEKAPQAPGLAGFGFDLKHACKTNVRPMKDECKDEKGTSRVCHASVTPMKRECNAAVTADWESSIFSVTTDARVKFLDEQRRKLLGLPEAGQSATQTK